jgi:hypothetical protein
VNYAVTFDGSTYVALVQNTNAEPDMSPSAWTVVAQEGGVGPTSAAGVASGSAAGVWTGLPCQ